VENKELLGWIWAPELASFWHPSSTFSHTILIILSFLRHLFHITALFWHQGTIHIFYAILRLLLHVFHRICCFFALTFLCRKGLQRLQHHCCDSKQLQHHCCDSERCNIVATVPLPTFQLSAVPVDIFVVAIPSRHNYQIPTC
jgi:hypothetical protein